MRTSQWSLLIAALMFVASIWFVLASLRAAEPRAAVAGEPAARPIASVRELMTGLIGPASDTVYKSVSIVVSAEGTKEFAPQNDEEWGAVSGAAAALAEAGNLLKAKSRDGASDADAWQKISQDMIDASLISMKAAEARDKEALLASGEALNRSCDNCHRSYDIE